MDTSVFGLIAHAGIVGKLVLLALLLASILCWGVIFKKLGEFRNAENLNKKFSDAFWASKDLDDLYAKSEKYQGAPVAALFLAGMKEFRRFQAMLLKQSNPLDSPELENISRSLQKTASSEVAKLEENIIWLATVASSGPFVGLFGTVWGIMTSFQRIGQSGAANLAVVAPGISEALIATAAGIGAAIPAAIFYNFFLTKIKRQSLDLDGFSQDFLNIVRRSHFSSESNSKKSTEGSQHGFSTP